MLELLLGGNVERGTKRRGVLCYDLSVYQIDLVSAISNLSSSLKPYLDLSRVV